MNRQAPVRRRALNIAFGAVAALITLSVAAGLATADERGNHAGSVHGRHDAWRGQSHRFNEHDLDRWRAGHWYHGKHRGRLGWWWIAGGLWYFYPAAIYPYPDPYLPPGVVVAPGPMPGGAPLYWYHCPNPPGYYPSVAACRAPWQRVPARPPVGVVR